MGPELSWAHLSHLLLAAWKILTARLQPLSKRFVKRNTLLAKRKKHLLDHLLSHFASGVEDPSSPKL